MEHIPIFTAYGPIASWTSLHQVKLAHCAEGTMIISATESLNPHGIMSCGSAGVHGADKPHQQKKSGLGNSPP